MGAEGALRANLPGNIFSKITRMFLASCCPFQLFYQKTMFKTITILLFFQ